MKLIKNIINHFQKKPEFKLKSPKIIQEKTINEFWENYLQNKIRKKEIRTGYTLKTVYKTSPSTMGIVREFPNPQYFQEYLSNAKEIRQKIMKCKPQYFEIQPIQIISTHHTNLRNYIMERVYPSMSIFAIRHVTQPQNNLMKMFLRKMKNKNVNFKELKQETEKGLDELSQLLAKNKINCSVPANNVLVLDYNPKTKKVLFGIVDWHDEYS